ncbi:hypothetical protein PGB90_006626 [Kerria lacca]
MGAGLNFARDARSTNCKVVLPKPKINKKIENNFESKNAPTYLALEPRMRYY